MLIDTHAHLTDSCYDPSSEDFSGITQAEIISGMTSEGIDKIITIGYDSKTSEGACKIAAQNRNVFFAAGIHPSEASRVNENDLNIIRDLVKESKCVAVGEIGLDYHYPDYDGAKQQKIMIEQMEIAAQICKPVVFHVRDAFGDSLKIIKDNKSKLTAGGVMHCYSGSLEMAEEFLKLGLYISFSGSLTFKNAVNLREVAKFLPHDRVLVETDCPYLAPAPFRGKINYPKNVRLVAEKLSEAWGLSMTETESLTTQNAIRLFKI